MLFRSNYDFMLEIFELKHMPKPLFKYTDTARAASLSVSFHKSQPAVQHALLTVLIYRQQVYQELCS